MPSPEKRADAPATGSTAAEPELFPNLDPALHTLNSVGTGGEANNQLKNLENLATQAAEMHENAPLHDQEQLDLNSSLAGFHDDSSLFTATGEARFMFDDKERQVEGQADFSAFDPEQPHTLNETAQAVAAVRDENGEQPKNGDSVEMGRMVGRNKRRRGDADYVVGPVENGDPIDPIKMKKDSHKEVERRRRENINDGIAEIARYIPNGQDPKLGKGQLLKLAAEYLNEMTERIRRFDAEMAIKEREKQELRTEVDHLHARLTEESSRSMQFEKSWRESEDRIAQSQFELNRVQTELEHLRGKQA